MLTIENILIDIPDIPDIRKEGSYDNYIEQKDLYKNTLYFTTDTHQLFYNDIDYSSLLKILEIKEELDTKASLDDVFELLSTQTKNSYSNGCLVTTDVDYNSINDDTSIYVEINGSNAFSDITVKSLLTFFISSNKSIYTSLLNIGNDIGNVYYFINTNGKLCFWFKEQSEYTLWDIYAKNIKNNGFNIITSIENKALPLSTEVTNLTNIINVTNIFNDKYVIKATVTGELSSIHDLSDIKLYKNNKLIQWDKSIIKEAIKNNNLNVELTINDGVCVSIPNINYNINYNDDLYTLESVIIIMTMQLSYYITYDNYTNSPIGQIYITFGGLNQEISELKSRIDKLESYNHVITLTDTEYENLATKDDNILYATYNKKST